MGTNNVIYLAARADLAVPSYRRPRAATRVTPTADTPWQTSARRRAAQRHAAPADALPSATDRPAAARAVHTVRVTRFVDIPQSASTNGRLRISGRLIDVCAELERLAAAETQAALPRRA